MTSSNSFSTPTIETGEKCSNYSQGIRRWVLVALLCCSTSLFCIPSQAQTAPQTLPPSPSITKTVQAVGYVVGGGSTKVDLKATQLMPDARGEAKVEIKSKAGRTSINLNVKGLRLPSTLGAEFLTYVVWVVTPEGRTGNTGELLLDKDGDGKLGATTPAQTFLDCHCRTLFSGSSA